MTWAQFTAIFDVYGPIAGVVIVALVMLFLIRKAWPTITQFVTSINTVATLPGKLTEIEKSLTVLNTGQAAMSLDVAHVKAEVQTNGGGSLKDSIRATEQLVKAVATDIRRVDRRVSQVETGQRLAAELLTHRTTSVTVETTDHREVPLEQVFDDEALGHAG